MWTKNVSITIPKPIRYVVPAGNYRAQFLGALYKTTPEETTARLRFEVFTEDTDFTYQVARNYKADLSEDSELRQVLATWRKHDLTPDEIRDGRINLDKEIGRKADLIILNLTNKNYSDPYVHIDKILPEGSLNLRQSEETIQLQPAFSHNYQKG